MFSKIKIKVYENNQPIDKITANDYKDAQKKLKSMFKEKGL
jgi:hypothetical protein